MSTIRLRKRVKEKAERDRENVEKFFPDDIIIDILSRLPAKSALRCQLVCRRWKDFISNHDFKELHLRHTFPMILVAHFASFRGNNGVDNLLLDEWWEPEGKRKRLVSNRFVVNSEHYGMFHHSDYWAHFSHGGLIVFVHPWNGSVVILNPTRPENVTINVSRELTFRSEIYGVFFHPVLREYCTLWRLLGVNGHSDSDQGYYKMLNLESESSSWREISNPWRNRVKIRGMSPVLIGEYLYWLVKPEQESSHIGRCDIMEFDSRSENFGLMRCPVPLDVDCVSSSSKVNLLDIDGVLSFVLISKNQEVVNMSIWKLKDAAQQVWVPMNHSIRVEDRPSFGISIESAVVGDQLVLLIGGRLYVSNLKLGTTRIFLKKFNNLTVNVFHVMSLVSLKNCKSKICMDRKGEVSEESDMLWS